MKNYFYVYKVLRYNKKLDYVQEIAYVSNAKLANEIVQKEKDFCWYEQRIVFREILYK